ncbi:hypothetical protein ACQKGO_10020 [Corallococcus interemptor]|uniref:hypothetical protein n=1 Tax=Corallococcus interemptor TaxID=2316720 RepID=UPI003CFF9540
MTHHPESAPNLRLRPWASRLALLVAAVSAVATSQATSADLTSEPYTGRAVQLTPDAPKAQVPFVVAATATKSPDKLAEAEVTVLVSATWTPTNPEQAARPWVRATLSEGDSEFTGPEASGVLVAGQSVTFQVHDYLGRDCTLGTRCEWAPKLNLELQPGAAPGTVEVVWTATASAHVVDTSSTPKGFAVIVSEP